MSLRPGIGALGMEVLARSMACEAGIAETLKVGDVPYQLRLGRTSVPLSRYLRRKLKDAMEVPDSFVAEARQARALEASAEVSALLRAALVEDPTATPRSVMVQRDAGRIAQIEARSKLKGTRTL